jgi:hypothetical protein
MGKTSYRTLQNQTKSSPLQYKVKNKKKSSRLQKYVCNWLRDAKQIRVGISLPELSIRALLVSRVQKYTPIEQGTVNISNHTVKVNHQRQRVCDSIQILPSYVMFDPDDKGLVRSFYH